jgi:hypothetical protein
VDWAGRMRAGVLAGGYLPYADVRYYTYAAVTRIAQDAKRAQRATAGAAAETAAAEDDITRNLYDVMANTPLKFGSLELNATAVAAKDTGEAAWCLVDGADVVCASVPRPFLLRRFVCVTQRLTCATWVHVSTGGGRRQAEQSTGVGRTRRRRLAQVAGRAPPETRVL